MIDSIRDCCWSCRQAISHGDRACPHCGAMVNLATGRGQPSTSVANSDDSFVAEASAYDPGASPRPSISSRKWPRIAAAILVLFVSGISFVAMNVVPAPRPATVESGPNMEVSWTKDQENGQRLHFLSKDEREFVLTDVIVNNRRECAPIVGQNLSIEGAVQTLGKNKLSAASDIANLRGFSKGIEGLALAMAKLQLPPPPWTFKLGDAKQTIFACDPITVYVETSLGNLRFSMRDAGK
ncbi:hypothetical protein JQ561_03815 [Bradyrhizobium diazoefficiens]|nr:hypothetical protein [Bradyrhizobium diazoefficiens]MBR0925722.1 hypothetical protein [Bradyrhizobium diazoefficiens]